MIFLAGFAWDTSKSFEYRKDRGSKYRVRLRGVVPKPVVIETGHRAESYAKELRAHPEYPIALDTEFDPETSELYSLQLSDGESKVFVAQSCIVHFAEYLADPKCQKIFHHAYADIPVLRHNGYDVQGLHADTLVLDWLVDENRQRHGLKDCASDWLTMELTEYKQAFGRVPEGKKQLVVPHISESYYSDRDVFVEYATNDAYATFWLYKHHRTILERIKLWKYYEELERPFTMVLCNMRERGLPVDVSILKEIGVELKKTMARIKHCFVAHAPPITVERKKAGVPVKVTLKPEEVNLKSPQQLASLFYDTIGLETVRKNQRTGKPDKSCRSTDREHLDAWAEQGNLFAQLIIGNRRAATQSGTFIGEEGGKGLLSHIQYDGETAIATSELYQAGTVTGRLSSKNPNLQNIPARKEKDPYRTRRAFIAHPGCKLIVADYGGAELRVLAHFSSETAMIEAFEQGLDLHSVTAKRAFRLDCAVEDVKELHPDLRNNAKVISFGLSYGMRAGLLSKNLGVSKEEAQSYIDKFFNGYPNVYMWIEQTVEEGRRRGFVRTILGRRRRVPELRLPNSDENWGKINHARNQAVNSPIQGSVADIIKTAMVDIEFDKKLNKWGAQLLLQVHDELIVEIPEKHADRGLKRVQKLMERAAVKCGLSIKLPADGSVGDNWEEAKV